MGKTLRCIFLPPGGDGRPLGVRFHTGREQVSEGSPMRCVLGATQPPWAHHPATHPAAYLVLITQPAAHLTLGSAAMTSAISEGNDCGRAESSSDKLNYEPNGQSEPTAWLLQVGTAHLRLDSSYFCEEPAPGGAPLLLACEEPVHLHGEMSRSSGPSCSSKQILGREELTQCHACALP